MEILRGKSRAESRLLEKMTDVECRKTSLGKGVEALNETLAFDVDCAGAMLWSS